MGKEEKETGGERKKRGGQEKGGERKKGKRRGGRKHPDFSKHPIFTWIDAYGRYRPNLRYSTSLKVTLRQIMIMMMGQ